MKPLVLIVLLASIGLYAAPPPDFFIKNDWYAVEIVLFEYDLPSQVRHIADEDLRELLPRELFPETIVLPLPTTSPHVSLQGNMADVLNTTFEHEPWFFNDQSVVRVREIKELLRATTNEGPSLSSRIDLTNLLLEAYPAWLEPDWFSPVETWNTILQSLYVPQSLRESLIANLFADPIQLPSENTPVELTPTEQVTLAFQAYENELFHTEGTWHTEGLELSSPAARIQRSALQLVHHGRFHTHLKAGLTGKSFFLQLDHPDSSGQYVFEVLLHLSKRLYLHADLKIWRTIPDLLEERDQLAEYRPRSRPLAYLLTSKRRIVDADPNYFDHPYFGMILKLDELPIPENLVELVETLDESSEPVP